MIRFWRLARLTWTMVVRTTALAWRAPRMPERDALAYRAHRQQVGCSVLCDILGINVHTTGSLPERRGMLVVSNHFGVLDPIILASAIPVSFVGKAELKNWPFVGWMAITHGLVLVDRERRTTVTQFTEKVKERLNLGVNVLVFPEGTTSPDPTILPFKTGAFEAVADEEDAYVLPVYLGVESVEGEPAVGDVRKRVVWSDPELPFLKHAWDLAGIRRVDVTVNIGDPIPTAGRDRKELAQVAQEAVEGLRTARRDALLRQPSHTSLRNYE